MYKFLTYMSIFMLLYGALLSMNQFLTGHTTTSIPAMSVFLLASFTLASRLSNIIDRLDQKPDNTKRVDTP